MRAPVKQIGPPQDRLVAIEDDKGMAYEYEIETADNYRLHSFVMFRAPVTRGEGFTPRQLLSALRDHLLRAQAEDRTRERALAITKIEEAAHWLMANDRALPPQPPLATLPAPTSPEAPSGALVKISRDEPDAPVAVVFGPPNDATRAVLSARRMVQQIAFSALITRSEVIVETSKDEIPKIKATQLLTTQAPNAC